MPRTGLSTEELKTKAIDVALKQMREVGFEKVRLTDIAREMKVSHAALYSHFKDKSALLDAISEKWLHELDEKLDAITEQRKDPCQKIHLWAQAIHKAKLEKVRRDPERYRLFDMATQESKPFVYLHLANLDRQLLSMVKEAVAKKKLRNANAESMTAIIRQACAAFHHPRLVSQYHEVERSDLLHDVVESVLKGLGLKS